MQAGLSSIAAFPLIGSALSLSASEAEAVGDGLVQAGANETAAVDSAAIESTIDRGEQELVAQASEGAEELGEVTAPAEARCPGGECFVAGTEVITGYNASTGIFSQTPIQDVQVGDQVLTRNQYDPNGPLEEQTVTATEQHVAYDLRDVTIQDADGSTETIRATDEHPFYVTGIGFTGAAQLAEGEQVETADGSYATVVSNVDEPQPNGIAVYNFTVGTDHTYFVDQNGVAIWVHNSCLPPFGQRFAGQDGPSLADLAEKLSLKLAPYEKGRTVAVALLEDAAKNRFLVVANSTKEFVPDALDAEAKLLGIRQYPGRRQITLNSRSLNMRRKIFSKGNSGSWG